MGDLRKLEDFEEGGEGRRRGPLEVNLDFHDRNDKYDQYEHEVTDYTESTKFTEYQRKMWYTLSQGAVSRFYHERDPVQGDYKIKKIGWIPLSFYWFMWTNTCIKVGYLLLSYRGWLGVEVHFLDQMSMWDWYLSTTHMVQEQVLWYSKYPMYEILHRQWTLQEVIFSKLGSPAQVSSDIHRTDLINSFYYPFVVFTGTFALAVQFFFTPKYALNTYAIIPDSWDSILMQVIFCIHECLFMYHAYAYQACTMVVAESMSTSYQHLLEDMTKTVYKLIQSGEEKHPNSSFKSRRLSQPRNSLDFAFTDATPENDGNQNSSGSAQKRIRNSAFRRQIMDDGGRLASNGSGGTYRRKPIRRSLHPRTKAPGTRYDILQLINDYRKIIMLANEHNKWIGKWMGGAQAANYAQFVSDVFLMIQLLKEPDFDLFGISFYVMDACFGMCMLFRMLILLSRLVPASDEFVQSVRCYAMYDTPLRKELLKTIPTLRRVAAKLSGYSVRPQSVPTGVNVLINFYISAAMWKRPDDPTRRT